MYFEGVLKDQMIDLLLGHIRGEIVACNILACLKAELLTSDVLKEFLKKCFEAYCEDPVSTPEELISQFDKVARGERPIATASRRSFRFACTKQTRALEMNTYFSTIMEVGTVIRHGLIKDSALGRSHATFLTNPDPADVNIKDAISGLNNRTDIYGINKSLGGNSHRPFFWIAPSSFISDERSSKSFYELGDTVRDLLGLIHIEENAPLIEICIPSDKLRVRKHARPTFIDAGDHRRFRHMPDKKNSQKKSGWGWTVHLSSFAYGQHFLDGSPERIVETTDFNVSLNVKFESAGITKIARGNTMIDNDMAFARRISNDTNIPDISYVKDTLKDLLS